MLIEKQLDAITVADLEALVREQTPEGRSLDYKREMMLATKEDKKELARDVASFANADGGDIVFGVQEAKDSAQKNTGIAEKLLGVADNVDAAKLQIENILASTIEPKVQGIRFQTVGPFDQGRPILIMRIPRSWNGPHMVTSSTPVFYTRSNAGKRPLDVHELRQSFGAAASAIERIRRFRDARLGRAVAGEMPVSLREADARFLIHLVPMADAALDLAALKERNRLRPPRATHTWNQRYNLDGLVTSAGNSQRGAEQRSYLQAFRNGAFECGSRIDRLPPDDRASRRVDEIRALQIETAVVHVIETCAAVLRDHGFEGPAAVMLSVIGARGAIFDVAASAQSRFVDVPEDEDHREAIDRDPLVVPDTLLESLNAEPRVALRGMFDALWQSGGWDCSPGYDDAGAWKADVHAT